MIEAKELEKKFKPTGERLNDIVIFIEEACNMWREAYRQIFEENRESFGRIIMEFFTLPRTELHDLFSEKILAPSRKMSFDIYNFRKKKEIDENQNLARKDKRFDDMVWDYQVVSFTELENGENIIVVWLSYMAKLKQWMWEKFWYICEISSKRHKDLYEKFSKKIPQTSSWYPYRNQ